MVERDASDELHGGPEVDAKTLRQWEMTHRSENFVESRTAGSIVMFEVSQPAGSFPGPAAPSYNLQIVRHCLGQASVEFGGQSIDAIRLPNDMVL